MMKSVFAAAAAISMSAGAAVAGPYVNVEANSSFAGSDYQSTTTEAHIGYAGATGDVSYYVQAGPALVSADGADGKGAFTGKGGASIAVSESVAVYGELSFASVDDADEIGYGTKIGATWNF